MEKDRGERRLIKRMGRPRKPIEEVKTTRSIRIPNKLWKFLEELAKMEDSTITLEIQKLVEKRQKKMKL